jgi:hypothetical protein
VCLWATLPAWKIKLAIGYTSDGKEFIQEEKKKKEKSNQMKSSRREPTHIHLFFVVMFFVMGEGPLGVGANDKSISAIKQ